LHACVVAKRGRPRKLKEDRASRPGPSRRLVLFGETVGLPQLLEVLEGREIAALVGAAIRPAQHGLLAETATRASVPLLIQPRAGDERYPAFMRGITALGADLFIVNSYSMILKPDLLAVPRNGAINVHGALLPAYRGPNPIEWALVNGEREAGVTIHAVDAGIDTGPIFAQRRVPILFEDTWIDVRRRVDVATRHLLAETLPAILAGEAAAQPQDDTAARHWPRRAAQDGAFDWRAPAISIYNLIRAVVAPHPGACAPDASFDAWQSLPTIVWRKFRSGATDWADARWQLVPRRPKAERVRRKANATITLDIRRRAGRTIGSCRLSDVGAPDRRLGAAIDYAQRARVSAAAEAELRRLVTRFALAELGRRPVFA
jgi:methionyl-tRNA formyltransferase